MQKLYVYVDETGQDARSDFFFVSVIIAHEDRDALIKLLEQIEQATGKGRRKWMDARHKQRLAYIQRVITTPLFKGRLFYAAYPSKTDFLTRTVLATARAITVFAEEDYKATVLIDGLQNAQVQWVGTEWRRLHIRTRKVRGVRKEEANELMRLADCVCGFVRAALTGNQEFNRLLRRAKKRLYPGTVGNKKPP
jgi:hypothetical protein